MGLSAAAAAAALAPIHACSFIWARGQRGVTLPKTVITKKHSLVFCSGGNHGGGPRGPCGVDPLTPNPDTNPESNHCKNQLQNHSLEKARIRPEVWPVNFYRGGNHTLEKTRIRPEIWPVYRGNSAPSLAARKGIAGHYRVGQLNHNLFFHQVGLKGRFFL